MTKRCSYHVMPKAVNAQVLKSRCEDDDGGERLTTLSDDDDAHTLHCSVTQQVSNYYNYYEYSFFAIQSRTVYDTA